MRILSVAIFFVVSVMLSQFAVANDGRAEKADVDLNSKYQEVMRLLPAKKKEILRDAQRAWIVFRDKACTFESEIKNSAGDSWIKEKTKPDMDRQCILRHTLERTSHLQKYLGALQQHKQQDKLLPLEQPRINDCSIKDLPHDFAVEAVGVYEGGYDTDVKLDSSGNATKSVKVTVNRPGENIILVLMAYDPVVWQIKRTPKSHIAGVIVGGYHAQAVLGIERSIPLNITTYTGRKDCGSYFYSYKEGSELTKANAVVKKILGSGIDNMWGNYTGRDVYVGAPPPGDATVSSDDYKVEDYTSYPRFPSGAKGLNRLIELGLLRRASEADLDAWVENTTACNKKQGNPRNVLRPHGVQGTFVVLGKMEYPAGLYGGNSVAFLIPPEVPVPTGNPGHSFVYFIDDGTCNTSRDSRGALPGMMGN